MSNLVPQVTPLDKGLDLQTAKIIAPAGSILDGLNYEQVDFQGQKRIEGYARYDGSLLPALDEYYVVEVSDGELVLEAGDILGGENDLLLGIVVSVEAALITFALINENALPEIGSTLYKITAGVWTGLATVSALTTGTDSGVTAAEHYDNLLYYTAILRDLVGRLPGAVIGLHWFRDRLYAVADVAAVRLIGTSTDIHPNDITLAGERVLDVSWINGDTLVFLNTIVTPYDSGDAFTTSAGGTGVISSEPVEIPSARDIASFFEARTELQVLDEDEPGTEDFGWRFIHLGWRVMFENGSSLYGDLAALNQNRTGVGIQGPTSTAGQDGKPLILTQKVSITNAPAQVNGWKSSDTPTTYTLNPADVADDDTDFAYADAYVSWDGSTGVVTAPGSDMVGLIEYPASATVVVEV